MKSFAPALVLGAAATALLASAACGDDSETSSTAAGGGSSTSASTSSSSPTSGPGATTGSSSDGGGTPTASTGEGAGDPAGTGSTGSGGEGGSFLPGDFDCSAPTGELPALVRAPVGTVTGTPLVLRQAPGDPAGRYFVATKDGYIYILEDGVQREEPFLDISGRVYNGSESGLLGLVFSPDYATTGRYFINYNSAPDGGGETYVAEYTVSADDPNISNTEEIGRVIQAPAFEGNHNGGSIEIGPDGLLYVSVGDGGDQGDPFCRAQDLQNRGGKILRADISTPGTYPGAAGNYPGADAYVFDIGFRNPWRMSFDVCRGDLWIADVGQDSWEEVSVHPDGDGPSNFEWNIVEGTNPFDCSNYVPACNPVCQSAGGDLIGPILEYSHQGEGNSVSGGFVYRGSAIPALRGAYIFGDYGSGRIWTTRYVPGDATPAAKTEISSLQTGGVVAFGQDNSGEVYILHQGGEIFRIAAE